MSRARDLADFGSNATSYDAVEIDHWRLTADFATNSATLTGWERNDDATSAYAGTGMTESSGVFTFPKTGLWKVTMEMEVRTSATDGAASVYSKISSNSGTNYDDRGYVEVRGDAGDVDGASGVSASILVNVTNASTFRCKFVVEGLGTGSAIKGNSSFDRTSVMFERITDSQ